MNNIKALAFGGCLCAALAMTGCVAPHAPADSSVGMNGLQQRALTVRNIGYDLGATYDEVWHAAVSTLQLNGFILRHADRSSGYIYGVWQNTYEHQEEVSHGGFSLIQAAAKPGVSFGEFFSVSHKFRQIEVSVTLESLAKTQTLVRISSRFGSDGIPMAEGTFANRFFGLLRKEIFLRKHNGSVYASFEEKNAGMRKFSKQTK